MKKTVINFIIIMMIPLGITLLQGCYPNESISSDQSDIVATGYNDSVDFTSLSTYFMEDTVYPIVAEDEEAERVKYQDEILSNMATNMANMGYTRLTEADTAQVPDVIILLSALQTTNTSVGWWYPYYPGWGWGGYPGWGWGGYPGYYPPYYYPPNYYVTSYTTGTLKMEMLNLNDYDIIEGDTLARIYWHGALHGVMTSSNVTNRINKGMNQAFTQSPYLNTGN